MKKESKTIVQKAIEKELRTTTGSLSNYVVEKKIGQGQFSTVFRAKTVGPDEKTVALKRIAEMMDAKARNDCIQEIGLLKNLDHPNIIKYIEGFIDGPELIIVLEIADAGDLSRMIKHFKSLNKNIPEKTIWYEKIEITIRKYFVQIASALKHMHDRRVMHRDIKPANVFITTKGEVKLGDLGLGRFLSNNTVEARSLVGTPYYMPPERIHEEPYSFKSDIWSMGCLLYEMAALRSPFYGEKMTLVQLCKKIDDCDYPPLPGGGYSVEMMNLIRDMIVSVPENRLTADQVYSVAKAAYEKHANKT